MKYWAAYLEIVDNALTVQEVVGDSKEIPVEGLAPWVLAFQIGLVGVLRLCRLEGEKGRDFSVHESLA